LIAPAKRPPQHVNVVDSSAWLEYFANGPGAARFAPAIEAVDRLIIPSVCLLEVFKIVLRQRSEGDALQAVALMRQGQVVDLDASLALSAAKLALEHKLPLADSIVYATTVLVGGTLWTQDEDFEGLANVEFHAKPTKG
jgi:predicted nucleic acid-binding protein